MAQFSDGPVEWPWCIQLVHGARSSRCSHWCPAAFPGTRISAAPLGGQKWERVSNSNCRKARKSQGMTLDGQPSTSTATTLKPLLPQADEALTWAALCPLPTSSLPPPPLRPTKIQRVRGKPNLVHQEHLNPLPPVAGVHSALARKNPECTVFSQTMEQSAAMHKRDKSA